MNPNDAKVWMNYAETDLRAAYALLESEEFFHAKFVFSLNNVARKLSKRF
jgi:hypothetical protein